MVNRIGLGALIKRYRKDHQISISNVACVINKSVAFVSRLENGKSEVYLDDYILEKVCICIGLPLLVVHSFIDLELIHHNELLYQDNINVLQYSKRIGVI